MSKSKNDWLVFDMDAGLLRVEPTRREAVRWCCAHTGGGVLRRYQYGVGAYEYVVGDRTDETVGTFFIERRGVVVTERGWDLSKPPVYGDPDNPHEVTY